MFLSVVFSRVPEGNFGEGFPCLVGSLLGKITEAKPTGRCPPSDEIQKHSRHRGRIRTDKGVDYRKGRLFLLEGSNKRVLT